MRYLPPSRELKAFPPYVYCLRTAQGEQFQVQYQATYQNRGMNGRTTITAFIKDIRREDCAGAKPDPESRLTDAHHGGSQHQVKT
jgi:hypothetical protein